MRIHHFIFKTDYWWDTSNVRLVVNNFYPSCLIWCVAYLWICFFENSLLNVVLALVLFYCLKLFIFIVDLKFASFADEPLGLIYSNIVLHWELDMAVAVLALNFKFT
jgi:hypothetical protein